MDRRTAGIIGTIVAVILCGCPGLAILCAGTLATVGTFTPDQSIDDPVFILVSSLAFICIGLLMLIVPLLIGLFTLRKPSKPARVEVIDYEEPLPPAI